MDVEYGPDGEPFDANKDYSEYERTELSWTQQAVVTFINLTTFELDEYRLLLAETVQRLAQSDEDADEIEAYHVEDAHTGLKA